METVCDSLEKAGSMTGTEGMRVLQFHALEVGVYRPSVKWRAQEEKSPEYLGYIKK